MTPIKIGLWTAPLFAMLLIPGLARAQSCASDTECSQGMVCHSDSVTACSGGTAVPVKCDPNTVCPTAPPATDPVCTNSTITRCVYRWDLPCNADLDCGDGFECLPSTMGTCSGSGPAVSGGGTSSGAGGGSGSGSAATPPAPPTTADAGTVPADSVCVTTTFYPGSCQPKVTTCTVDADCPSVFKCVDMNAPTTISSSPIAPDGGATATPTIPTTSTPAATVSKTCQSPTAYPGRTDGVGTSGPTINLGSATDGGATTKGTTTPPVAAVPAGDSASSTPGPATKTTGGCVLGSDGAPGGSSLILGLFGALALARRCRSRKG